jgi:hypothetical protein
LVVMPCPLDVCFSCLSRFPLADATLCLSSVGGNSRRAGRSGAKMGICTGLERFSHASCGYSAYPYPSRLALKHRHQIVTIDRSPSQKGSKCVLFSSTCPIFELSLNFTHRGKGFIMLRTIVLGSCVSVQGLLVRQLENGHVVIRVGERMYEGQPVVAPASPPQHS